MVAKQNATNQQMWDWVAQLVAAQQPALGPLAAAGIGPQLRSWLWAQKMTPEDDPEAYMNAFE